MKIVLIILNSFLFIGCIANTGRETESSEPEGQEELSEPAELAGGVMPVKPDMPQISYKSGTAEVVTQQTIMKFVGKDKIDESFFSRVILVENYKNGKKHGKWIYYNGDASIDKIEEYRDGELVE